MPGNGSLPLALKPIPLRMHRMTDALPGIVALAAPFPGRYEPS
jgi:hypothetical protein